MSYQRKYDFQAGTRISSNQVDEEFNQLIAAVNQIQSDDNSKDVDLRSRVQMSKITNDNGGVKLSVTDPKKNILNELLNLSPGLHTFYSVSGTVNNPTPSVSIRGVFHQTAQGYGWVYAQDSNGTSYENYVDGSTWRGWKGGQTVLYTSTSGIYLTADQTVTPTKKLSQTKNGWILIFSDYDPGVGANNYDWTTNTIIPKFMGANHNGQPNLFAIPSNSTGTVVTKKAYVYDDKIVGHDDNTANGANDVVLRYIIEW
jgi:hypothetical protein